MTLDESLIELDRNIKEFKRHVKEYCYNVNQSKEIMKGRYKVFDLWARKRPINGYGQPYQYIESFDKEEQKFYMMDKLDRNIYQEAMILENHVCIMSREFEKPLIRRLKK